MKRVVIVGGGLAGLAAAVALAPRGFAVMVLEARQRLGGRASSFNDPVSGQTVDACQHVSMGCCTNFHHFCETIGVRHLLEPQPRLFFQTPDGRISRFQADPWSAPFHLARALASAHYLTPGDKLRIGYGLVRMLAEHPDADPPLLDWLMKHRQTPRTIARFWGVVLVSALNDTVDRLGLKYARKVFRDGFVRHRDGFTVHVPKVPLVRLYGEELQRWLTQHGVTVRMGTGVSSVFLGGEGQGVILRPVQFRTDRNTSHSSPPGQRGTRVDADHIILAVPFDRVLDLLPASLASDPFFARIGRLEPSPITSVHLWFDRPVLDQPHLVLLDSLSQWVFSRGEVAPGEYYLQVVVSAAGEYRGLGRDEVRRRILAELGQIHPKISHARLIRDKVVTEHAATFRAVPGGDALRPPQKTPIPNLFLAGDYTATGWPATMEGSVRSGYLAAEAVLEQVGRAERITQPDLG
jgi:squalene-associated FAD-dependent desaturase